MAVFVARFLWILFVISFADDYKQDSSVPIRPNIMVVMADDWGNNDWNIGGCSNAQTPFVEKLAKDEGIILKHNYVQKVCSPSRASFLTGRYPSTLGLQNNVFNPDVPVSLTRQVSLLSEEFKSAGYSTHLVGKWHLGMQAWEYTPTYRGFDTFSGFYGGMQEYFTHESCIKRGEDSDGNDLKYCYYDLRIQENEDSDGVDDETFGVFIEKEQALQALSLLVGADDPFFFFLSFQASHNPTEQPDEYSDLIEGLYSQPASMDTITYNKRKGVLGQSATLDDSFEEIVKYMKSNGLWDNTLVLFTSDNGGATQYGDNFPFRGTKNTSWEGGIRVPGFLTGGFLPESRHGQTLENVIVSSVDWYPTLLSASGIEAIHSKSEKLFGTNMDNDDRFDDMQIHVPLDGQDLWKYIAYQDATRKDAVHTSNREVLLDLNPVYCPFESCGAIRVGKYKYLRGANVATNVPFYDKTDEWQRLFHLGECNLGEVDPNYGCSIEVNEDSIGCHDSIGGCLFNIEDDPCEYVNLAETMPHLVSEMVYKLKQYQTRSPKPLIEDLWAMDIDECLPTDGGEFWGPYQEYTDVEFENQLKDDYQRIFENQNAEQKMLKNNGNNHSKQSSNIASICLIVIALLVMVAIIMWCQFKNQIKGMRNYGNNETLPLLNAL